MWEEWEAGDRLLVWDMRFDNNLREEGRVVMGRTAGEGGDLVWCANGQVECNALDTALRELVECNELDMALRELVEYSEPGTAPRKGAGYGPRPLNRVC